jgi:EmrB/QacA subfamily drug resistance transporter
MAELRVGGRAVPTWAVLAVCCVAQFMVVLDVSIVNVALPQMRSDLGLSTSGQQWVVNAYTLTFAGFLMLGGRAADLFGRRRIFLLGLSLFTVCSLIGGLAQNGSWLIAARAAQGIGGAILAPATLSLLTSKFTDPHERRKALGAWSATAASGAAVGVLLGGVLTDIFDWRWVLFVNVPIGIVLLITAAWALTESRSEGAHRSLDLPGAVTITAGLAVVVYAIVNTDTHAWGSTETLVTLAAGLVLLAAFFVIEVRFAAQPLIPLRIFRHRALSAANGIAVTIGAAIFGMYFFLSLYLQQVNDYSPLKAGLAFFPTGLATTIGAMAGTRIVPRLGARRQLIIGPILAAIGLFWLTGVSVDSSYAAHVLGPMILVGIGLGVSFVPMTIAATTGVAPQEAGLASGLINTTRQIGGAVGLAAMATLATSAAAHHGPTHHDALAALTTGYDRAFLICGVALLAGALLAGLFLPARARAAGNGATASGQDAAASREQHPVAVEI